MTARDFGDDANHDYLVVDTGAVTSLTAYTLICLFAPHSTTRGAAIAIRNAGGNAVQMIRDSGKWFYGGDFSAGYSGFSVVADHWTWAAITHPAGSNVCTWHHKDITAGGSIVHGAGAFAVGNPGAITGIRIGDGDNESHAVIAAGAIYGSVLTNTELDTAFSNRAADAFALGPLAMWLGSSNMLLDVTGNGADGDEANTVGTVGFAADPPGFDYALSTTVALTGAAAIGGVSGAGALKRVVRLTGAAGVGGVAGAGALRRRVELAGASHIGGITGRGSIGAGAVAGRRPLRTSSVARRIVTIGPVDRQSSSTVTRPS